MTFLFQLSLLKVIAGKWTCGRVCSVQVNQVVTDLALTPLRQASPKPFWLLARTRMVNYLH